MGPNGSGKSTLAYSSPVTRKYTSPAEGHARRAGSPGDDLDERARAGMFLAMQYPVEVPGLGVELPAHRR